MSSKKQSDIVNPLDRLAIIKRLKGGTGSQEALSRIHMESYFKSCTGGLPLPYAVFMFISLDMAMLKDISSFNLSPSTIASSEHFNTICDALDNEIIQIQKIEDNVPYLNRKGLVSFIQSNYTDWEYYLPWLEDALEVVDHLAKQKRTIRKNEFLSMVEKIIKIDVELHGDSAVPLRVITICEIAYSLLGWKSEKNPKDPHIKFKTERSWLKKANINRDSGSGARGTKDNDYSKRIAAIKKALNN